MRYAILSDVHGNDVALRAVFEDLDHWSEERGTRVDQIWCLGDVVGYGPEPGDCVRRIRARTDITISGNHDWAVVGKLDLGDFSESAAQSAEWTRAISRWSILWTTPAHTRGNGNSQPIRGC